MSKDVYVWYSPATDVTGKKIQANLDATGGTNKPPTDKKTVICWGTKTKEAVVLKNDKVLNHPDNIRTNRNKLLSLEAFQKEGCNVAPFTDDFKKADSKGLEYPLIARTKYHQGGAGFWLCLNAAQMAQAANEGAQYIQKFIEIKDEYRLHVVEGKVVYAVKKVMRNNHKEAFTNHYTEHVENFAKKQKIDLDKATVDVIMDRMSRKFATGSDMVVRSNTRGWKFSKLDITKLNKDLVNESVKALKALKLNYGAVDCCIGSDNKPYIIECNTGPGLEGSSLEAWSAALKNLTKVPKKKPVDKPVAKPAAKNVKNNVVGKAEKVTKQDLKAKASFLNSMIDAASDEEVGALSGLWKKMGIID